jgi:hypothetical protein
VVVSLAGVADSSPVYLPDTLIEGARRSAFFVATAYGRTLAVSPAGKVLWVFTPSSYASYAGTARITNASPALDPDRRYLYSASPDGYIYKLSVATGRELRGHGWPVRVTRLASREKISSSLTVSRGSLLVTTAGYYGDIPPYQGHVTLIDLASGRVTSVFNALCSTVHTLLLPASECAESDAGIWGRAGAVVDPASGDVLIATGNAAFNGVSDWGDSVLELSPTARRIVATYTPTNQAALNAGDLDLGSTAPALLATAGPIVAIAGKDGVLRLIDLGIQGVGHLGGELQDLPSPAGQSVFSAMSVWRRRGRRPWLYVADASATAGYRLQGAGRASRLVREWSVPTAGTTPVLAGGLLYVYDPNGALNVYTPTTGARIATLPASPGHWNSPIIDGGSVALPVGDANDHLTKGQLDLYRIK